MADATPVIRPARPDEMGAWMRPGPWWMVGPPRPSVDHRWKHIGTTAQQHCVLLDTPVFRDGEVVYALNVAIRAPHLASLLAEHRTPPGWAVSMLDRQDRIVARSGEHERFVGQLANASLRR